MRWKTAETIYNLGIVTKVFLRYIGWSPQDSWNPSCLFQMPLYFWHYKSSVLEARLLKFFFWRRDPSTEMFDILGKFAVRPSWCFPQTYLVPDKVPCSYLPYFVWNWSFKHSGCVTIYNCPFTCQLFSLWMFLPFFRSLLEYGGFLTYGFKKLFNHSWWLSVPDTFSYFWYSKLFFQWFFFGSFFSPIL